MADGCNTRVRHQTRQSQLTGFLNQNQEVTVSSRSFQTISKRFIIDQYCSSNTSFLWRKTGGKLYKLVFLGIRNSKGTTGTLIISLCCSSVCLSRPFFKNAWSYQAEVYIKYSGLLSQCNAMKRCSRSCCQFMSLARESKPSGYFP